MGAIQYVSHQDGDMGWDSSHLILITYVFKVMLCVSSVEGSWYLQGVGCLITRCRSSGCF